MITRRDMIAELRDCAFAIDGAKGWCVPEPFVKQLLSTLGALVPKGVIVEQGALPSTCTQDLHEPFALKAWGPGIVHKSDLGAVRVGVSMRSLDSEAEALLEAVSVHGVHDARLYVEEMAVPGVELLFGMVERPPFGVLVTMGLGGTLAEVLDDVSVGLSPLTVESAEAMVDSFKGTALLNGFRGTAAADRGSLISTMMALAGPGGLPKLLGEELAEFECNPLFVSASGVTIADARLILSDPIGPAVENVPRAFDSSALFSPKSIAVVGASAQRTGWGNRTLARYRKLGWDENLYAVHPTADWIDGVPAYRSLGEIPGGVDYAEISVPAEAAPAALRSANGNVKAATINSAGFSESSQEGEALEAELLKGAVEGGVRLVGPNCMGVYSPLGRQAFSGAELPESGHIGAVLQSGGLSTDLVQVGIHCGLRFSSVVSAGNAADIGIGDLARYLLEDEETKIIAIHVEGGADPELVRVIQDARGAKPIVLFLPGLSSAGARVAASHTGTLTSDQRGWEALATTTGATVTRSFEQLVATLRYLDCFRAVDADDDDSALIIGLGGGASVLAADACDAEGIRIPALPSALQSKITDKKGAILINPLDLRLGPAGPPTWASEVIEIVMSTRPFSDVLVHVDAMNYVNSTLPGRLPGLSHFIEMMGSLSEGRRAETRLAVVTRNLERAPGSFADKVHETMLDVGLPAFERFADAAGAIAAAKRFTHHRLRNGLGASNHHGHSLRVRANQEVMDDGGET